jgi:hypothetical protein
MNIFLFIAVVFMTPAQAYLDPGTGSMLLSTLIALVATLIYSIKSFVFKIKSFIARLFGEKIEKIQSNDIIFYNEGEQYFTTFYPILKELTSRGIKFTYLYSEENDTIVKKLKDIDTYYIGKGNKAFFFLNTLEAKICIMTTPSLDVLQIKRSKGVKHYCHIAHSTGGCIGYEVFGTDYFDSVLIPNKYDKEFIEKLEEKRNLPQKDIRIIGTPYLDYFLKRLKTLGQNKTNKNTILISPTWGDNGLLAKYGSTLLSVLLSNHEHDIIVRPHPQSIRYEKQMLDDLKHTFKENKNIQWDESNDGLQSMTEASIMISDFSGIILDFLFLFSKPVISIPGVIDLRGKDYINIDNSPWYIDFYYKNTTICQEDNILNINETIETLRSTNNTDTKNDYQKYNPYFRTASSRTVDCIEDIFNNIQNGEI